MNTSLLDFPLTGTPWNGQDPNQENTPWGNLIEVARGGVVLPQNPIGVQPGRLAIQEYMPYIALGILDIPSAKLPALH